MPERELQVVTDRQRERERDQNMFTQDNIT